MRRQKERTQLAPQCKPGRCSESAMDYGVDIMVKKQKTLQRFWKYAVESIMNMAIICVDVRMARTNIFNSFALGHTFDSTTWSISVVGYCGKEHVHSGENSQIVCFGKICNKLIL